MNRSSSYSNQFARTSVLVAIGASMCYLGLLIILVAIHDAAMPEDLTALWMCHQMGNDVCGPTTPAVQVNPMNLFYNWDMVFPYWWRQVF